MGAKLKQCPEFPYFGASYPDARCIDGFLWDLDKCDNNGMLYGGGEEPCPFCNSALFVKQNSDGVNNTYKSLRLYVKNLKAHYLKRGAMVNP